VPILRIKALILLFLLQSGAALAIASPSETGEELEYTLTFRGLLTGFVKLDIAKLTLSVEPEMAKVGGRDAYITRLQMTTEPYTKAELLYPLRLDYYSWLDSQRLQPLVAAKSLRTRESRQEFFWWDRPGGKGYHYQTPMKEQPEHEERPPEHLRQFASLVEPAWPDLLKTKQIELEERGIVDYMGLLHQLRQLPLVSGEWYEFSVFTGKRIEQYRVKGEKTHLKRGGWNLPAYHLKLYEAEPDKGKLKDEVNLWLSDDEDRRLIRFYAERTAGALEGILETGRPENGRHDNLSESTQKSLETYLGF
jgi:hypothetical protein